MAQAESRAREKKTTHPHLANRTPMATDGRPAGCTPQSQWLLRGASHVCCDARRCVKTFARADAYERERDVYLRGLPYVPPLLAHDDATRTLHVARVGDALANKWTSGVPVVSRYLTAPTQHAGAARALFERFHTDTGLHHNDPAYKNIVRAPHTGALFLVDFEHAHPERHPRDHDGILAAKR